MKRKLSDIFIPVPCKSIYMAHELFSLKLQPDFINKMAHQYHLHFDGYNNQESNLCFTCTREVSHEYRTSFSQMDIVMFVIKRVPKFRINVALEHLDFPEKVESFWGEVLRDEV